MTSNNENKNTFNCGDIAITTCGRGEALNNISLYTLQNEFEGYDGQIYRTTSRAGDLTTKFSGKFPHKQIQPFAVTYSTSVPTIPQHTLAVSVILNKAQDEAFGEQLFILFDNNNFPNGTIMNIERFKKCVQDAMNNPPEDDEEENEEGNTGEKKLEGFVDGGYEVVVEDGKIVDIVKNSQ